MSEKDNKLLEIETLLLKGFCTDSLAQNSLALNCRARTADQKVPGTHWAELQGEGWVRATFSRDRSRESTIAPLWSFFLSKPP